MDMKSVTSPQLNLKNVQVYWQGIPLFDPLSLHAGAGDCVHIKGPNGIGKTKFLEALAGLYEDFTGQIHISDSQDFIGTKLPFDGHRTVWQNMSFWAALRGTKIDQQHDLQKAIQHLYGKPFDGLSSGQKQLVNLARLSLSLSDVWILDEPFSYLDEMVIADVMSLIKDFCQKGGVCILTSHHPLESSVVTQGISLSVETMMQGRAA